MIIPSIKEIFLFILVNFCAIISFNILLFDKADFITHVTFYEYLTINTGKMVKLASLFLLTSFILNLIFFRIILLKRDYKAVHLSAIRVSMGVFLTGIAIAILIILINGF